MVFPGSVAAVFSAQTLIHFWLICGNKYRFQRHLPVSQGYLGASVQIPSVLWSAFCCERLFHLAAGDNGGRPWPLRSSSQVKAIVWVKLQVQITNMKQPMWEVSELTERR